MDERYLLPVNAQLNHRYIIQNSVGTGGFGITYKAFDQKTNAFCAIKELFPRDTVYRLQDGRSIAPFSESKRSMMEHCITRFGEEAQLLQQMSDIDAVVKIYDFFYENETCYFVMEFLDGVNLSKLMRSKSGKLPMRHVMEVARQAGTALAEVHRRGIFHRDISPDNIYITNQGKIKLIDFGNAKHLVKKEGEIHSVVLKKGYAPMEQYSQKGVQGTYTDVYSFAFTLYYALTGIHPPDVFDYQKDGYKDLASLGFPKDLSDAFDKALKINYKERTQTMGEFLRDLGPYVSGQAQPAQQAMQQAQQAQAMQQAQVMQQAQQPQQMQQAQQAQAMQQAQQAQLAQQAQAMHQVQQQMTPQQLQQQQWEQWQQWQQQWQQQQMEWQQEQQRQAELQRQQELQRQAELQRQQELQRQAELRRQQEIQRQAELQRQQEIQRQAEQQRQAELQRQHEQQRLQQWQQQLMQNARPAALTPYVDVYMGNKLSGCYMIQASRKITIGRSASVAELVVDEMHVSSKHCELYYSAVEHLFYIQDFSTNGTYLNGSRLRKGSMVTAKAGDQLALGGNSVILYLREE